MSKTDPNIFQSKHFQTLKMHHCFVRSVNLDPKNITISFARWVLASTCRRSTHHLRKMWNVGTRTRGGFSYNLFIFIFYNIFYIFFSFFMTVRKDVQVIGQKMANVLKRLQKLLQLLPDLTGKRMDIIGQIVHVCLWIWPCGLPFSSSKDLSRDDIIRVCIFMFFFSLFQTFFFFPGVRKYCIVSVLKDIRHCPNKHRDSRLATVSPGLHGSLAEALWREQGVEHGMARWSRRSISGLQSD